MPHIDTEKISTVGEIVSPDEKQNSTWYLAKELLVEPVRKSLENFELHSVQRKGVPASRILQNFIQAWDKENMMLDRAFPRLAFVRLGGSDVLCSVFPISLGIPELGNNDRVLLITTSAITYDWLEDFKTHPSAKNPQMPIEIAKFLTLYAGYTQPDLAEQYQASCDAADARSVNEAMKTIAHQDGPWSVVLASSLGSNDHSSSLLHLIGSSPHASLHQISHAHGMSSLKSGKVAATQLEVGLLGGFDAQTFVFAPEVHPDIVTAATGLRTLSPKTEIDFLLSQNNETNRRQSVVLSLHQEHLYHLAHVLRSMGLAVKLEESQIVGTLESIKKEGDAAPMKDIAQLGLNTI